MYDPGILINAKV